MFVNAAFPIFMMLFDAPMTAMLFGWKKELSFCFKVCFPLFYGYIVVWVDMIFDYLNILRNSYIFLYIFVHDGDNFFTIFR